MKTITKNLGIAMIYAVGIVILMLQLRSIAG